MPLSSVFTLFIIVNLFKVSINCRYSFNCNNLPFFSIPNILLFNNFFIQPIPLLKSFIRLKLDSSPNKKSK
ncbi:TPA: hypothetical protein DEG21_06135 [Patescibacteria group bacterium]|nr:hypothetical protein [Candidatus Gracilibacteria bacterium]